MTKTASFLVLGMILLTSCATPNPTALNEAKFSEENSADIVVRYYSDQISRVLKPMQAEGQFLTSFDRGSVLNLAKQQAKRELAVVILLQFNASDTVKRDWMTMLKGVGYKRIVFLRAQKGMNINGLPILESPTEITRHSQMQTRPSV
ncbi:MAG: hypothetical protein WCT12_03650 [Verrucomicrobiota bacterium]|jgi:hypothetical protein